MRQSPTSKRGRGRSGGRRSYNNSANRSYDSSGPDVKVRGSANHIYDKYQVLARDAFTSGDRVAAENYLQHAEHYFRILSANNAAQNTNAAQDQPGADPAQDQPGANGRGRGNGQRPSAAPGDRDRAIEPASDEPAALQPESSEQPTGGAAMDVATPPERNVSDAEATATDDSPSVEESAEEKETDATTAG
jgi:hypothetical protein